MLALFGPPVVNGQFLAVGASDAESDLANCQWCNVLADLSIIKEFLFDQLNCERKIIDFTGVIALDCPHPF
jgi:hypothetical protein